MAVLTARHWGAVHAYAEVCLAAPAQGASVVAAAAFHQVLEGIRPDEPAVRALRPQLLVAVRDKVKAWSNSQPIRELLPELGRPAVGRSMRAAKLRAADNRQLAVRSFRAMSGPAQCLLWHAEVEGEPISVPAALLALDAETARTELAHAREKFRRGCLLGHIESAPKAECRYYNRLLDVPIRRGGALLPDVRKHLAECGHCRDTAEQLRYFNGKLDVLLAEAVLGWGARRYLDSRPGRGRVASASAASKTSARPVGRHSAPGRYRVLPHFPALDRVASLTPEYSKSLFTGLGFASALLAASVLAVSLWPHQGDNGDSTGTGGASADYTGPPAPSGTSSQAPPIPSGMATGAFNTRLRNAASDLCLDIRGPRVRTGTGTKLAVCSSARTQQWSYEDDGRLRSVAEPGLCLNSHGADGSTDLSDCTGPAARAADIRYDLTVRGELLPRWQEDLALSPASVGPDADVMVRIRDGSDAQRWLTDRVADSSPSRPIEGGTPSPSTKSGPSSASSSSSSSSSSSAGPVTDRPSASPTATAPWHNRPNPYSVGW